MLIIKTPRDNLKERKYIIQIIFNEFLNIEYHHEIGASKCEITLENNHRLIIEDHFFSKNTNDLDYLSPHSVPSKVEYTSNDFTLQDGSPGPNAQICQQSSQNGWESTTDKERLCECLDQGCGCNAPFQFKLPYYWDLDGDGFHGISGFYFCPPP